MMTSNFARGKRLPNAVGIALKAPWWYKGRQYQKLAPTARMLKLGEGAYKRAYARKLKGLDAHQVLQELVDYAVLLCWESPGKFCHRRLVAAWLERELGIEVPEFCLDVAKGQQTVF